jgi:predicted nucleic acid-binding protein
MHPCMIPSRNMKLMADIFVDTGGWGNIFAPKEPHHELASHIYQLALRQRRKLVTTSHG